jgi:transposase-like protein
MTHKEKMEFWAKRAKAMQALREKGVSYAIIAKEHGVHRQRVYQILQRLEQQEKQ